MKLSKKITAIALATVTMSAVCGAVVANTSMFDLTRAVNNTAYSCASIHFGPKATTFDSNLQGKTYDCSTAFTSSITDVIETNGVTIQTASYTKVYYGGVGYTDCAIRVGASKNKGIIEITLNENIIGATVYAMGYSNDSTKILVNNVEIALTENIPSVTQANAINRTYIPYTVSFLETNILRIESKNATSCRFYLADVALRVSGSASTIEPEDPYTPTHTGTENDPYDMEDAFNIIKEGTGYSENEIYITGTVQEITYHNTKYDSYTAIISDTESEHTITVYSGTIDENAGYTDLQEGDFIIARGHYTYYNNTIAELAGTSGVSYPVFVSITR